MSQDNQSFDPPQAEQRVPENSWSYQPSSVAAPAQASPGGFKRGFGMGIGLGLGFTAMMVALSIVAGIVSVASLSALVSSTAPEASTQTTAVWGDKGASGKLRAISVTGPILTDSGGGGLFAVGAYGYEIAEQLDDLEADDAAAVVLLVNTPGGAITGSKAISDAIERYQERTGQKVYVHVEGMSASGGVYSTAPADEIVADYGSLVGSIGVIFGPFSHYEGVTATANLSDGFVQAESITQEYLTAGRGKDFGNPYREMTDDERQVMNDMLQIEYDNFVNHVAAHRPIEASAIVDDLGAHIFDSQTAQDKGLVDSVMGRDEFFRHVAEDAGLDPDDTVVEKIAPPSPWASLFGATRAHGESPALSVEDGSASLINRGFCDQRTPLVFAGDIASVCGQR